MTTWPEYDCQTPAKKGLTCYCKGDLIRACYPGMRGAVGRTTCRHGTQGGGGGTLVQVYTVCVEARNTIKFMYLS